MDRKEDLVARVREVATKLGRDKLSQREFTRETGVNPNTIAQNFKGWGELCRLAGVTSHRRRKWLDDEELFAAMRDTFLALGGVPPQTRFFGRFPYSRTVFDRRGRTWNEMLALLHAWLLKNDPGFPYLDQLLAGGPAAPDAADEAGKRKRRSPHQNRLLGEYIGFRGMSHAPVNEAGVAVLFGMVAEELGFVVQFVGQAFPDCDALRLVSRRGPARYRRLRVEFEHRSSNFRLHRHDPRGCDLIVCWEHDWTEGCPLPVLELKSAIRDLAARRPASARPRFDRFAVKWARLRRALAALRRRRA
jgi:hypothetical protein